MSTHAFTSLTEWFILAKKVLVTHWQPIYLGYSVVVLSSLAVLIANQLGWSRFNLFYIFFLSPVVSVGWQWYLLQLVRKGRAQLSDLFVGFSSYLPLIVTFIFLTIKIAVGFFLLIVPGVIWMLQAYFVLLVLVDKKLSIGESFRRSQELTNGHKWKLLVLALLGVLLGVLATPFTMTQQRYGFGAVELHQGVLYLLSLVITPLISLLPVVAYDELSKAVKK